MSIILILLLFLVHSNDNFTKYKCARIEFLPKVGSIGLHQPPTSTTWPRLQPLNVYLCFCPKLGPAVLTHCSLTTLRSWVRISTLLQWAHEKMFIFDKTCFNEPNTYLTKSKSVFHLDNRLAN